MYTGSWRNCSKHGLGLLKYGDGSQYEGSFENDFPEGRGVKTF